MAGRRHCETPGRRTWTAWAFTSALSRRVFKPVSLAERRSARPAAPARWRGGSAVRPPRLRRSGAGHWGGDDGVGGITVSVPPPVPHRALPRCRSRPGRAVPGVTTLPGLLLCGRQAGSGVSALSGYWENFPMAQDQGARYHPSKTRKVL